MEITRSRVKFNNADVPTFNVIDESHLHAIDPDELADDDGRMLDRIADSTDDGLGVETVDLAVTFKSGTGCRA